jgi:hypothetical protein
MTPTAPPATVVALPHYSTGRWVLIIVGLLVVISIVAALIRRVLVRRGLSEPFVVRMINRWSERFIDLIKAPITLAVLDEVAQVLQTGHYTQNIAAALEQNREEILAMVAEKIKADPTARHVGLLPFHDRLIHEVSETTMRMILEVLADPRTDELVSDMLRDNITQIRQAVRVRKDTVAR